MRLLILSDIHGNYTALKAVMEKAVLYKPDACVILGDIIDYGPHSNEVVQIIREITNIICNIWGNHEFSIVNDSYERFSSERGKKCAQITKGMLTDISWDFINTEMIKSGQYEFSAGRKKCLAIHGNIQDEYWGTISPKVDANEYLKYDFVFSGHSHIPHFFEKYVTVSSPLTRNKKKIIFINPGSVGQPRNLNNMAQYAVLDTETEDVEFCKVPYDISAEQRAFCDQVDKFYKERLRSGI